MKTLVGSLLACLLFTVAVSCAQDEEHATLSTEPLTAEQIAIYRVVLSTYRKGSKAPLNVSNKTEPLQPSQGCTSRVKFDSTGGALIHRIDGSTTLGSAIVLVDPDRQQEAIDQNDPQNLIKKAVDDHEKVTDKELNDTVKRAFESGVFAMSEIVFDKEHRFAIVAYSFVCGGLCGNGSTLVLRKTGQKWRVIRRCGGWIS